jgi:hypothetical protein
MTYLILNTEGKDYLYEIAIIDPTGNLIYEAFTTAIRYAQLSASPPAPIVR